VIRAVKTWREQRSGEIRDGESRDEERLQVEGLGMCRDWRWRE